MISTGRLYKLFLALTAKERALLVLKAWKEGGDEDRLVRSTMPDDQGPEFNRYIELMNAVNQRIGVFVIMERILVDQLSLRYGWLLTLKLWAMQDLHLACAFFARWREPIGESEHRVLQAEHKETIRPDWSMAYDVYPDGHEECAERARAAAHIIRDTLRNSPVVTDLPELFGGSRPPREGTRSVREELWDAHVDRLRDGLVSRWAEMRAAEEVLAEVAVEFESEDPALPDVRAILASIRSDLMELREQLSAHAGAIDLPADVDQELVIKLRYIAGVADTNR